MEVVGGVASVLQVAEIVLSLAATLYKYASKARGAEKDVKALAGEVKLTARVLQRAHEQIAKEEHSAEALDELEGVLGGCKEAFGELNDALERTAKSSSSGKISMTLLSKAKWPLKAEKVDVLRANLERLKTTLLLLLGVLAYSSRKESLKAAEATTFALEKLQIENLIKARDDAIKRCDDLSRALASAEAQSDNGTHDARKHDPPDSAPSNETQFENGPFANFILTPKCLNKKTVASEHSREQMLQQVSDAFNQCGHAVIDLAESIDSKALHWHKNQARLDSEQLFDIHVCMSNVVERLEHINGAPMFQLLGDGREAKSNNSHQTPQTRTRSPMYHFDDQMSGMLGHRLLDFGMQFSSNEGEGLVLEASEPGEPDEVGVEPRIREEIEGDTHSPDEPVLEPRTNEVPATVSVSEQESEGYSHELEACSCSRRDVLSLEDSGVSTIRYGARAHIKERYYDAMDLSSLTDSSDSSDSDSREPSPPLWSELSETEDDISKFPMLGDNNLSDSASEAETDVVEQLVERWAKPKREHPQ